MANTNNTPTTLQWGASTPKTLNTTGRVASDAVAVSANAVGGAIAVLIDNQSTPAAGDTVDLWIAWSVDGTNYDTDEHAQPLGRMSTVGADDPGEDPARETFDLFNLPGKQSFKLIARANQGATRNIVISAVFNPLLSS